MKINTKVNGKDISITLTKEQLQEIAKQTSSIYTIGDIKSIEDAEEVLKTLNNKEHIRYSQDNFLRKKDWINYQIETIIKAANYIDNNNQIWRPNFDNNSIYKYIPYFEKRISGWVVSFVYAHFYCSFCSVCLYYKEQSTAKLFSERFITLYNQMLEL